MRKYSEHRTASGMFYRCYGDQTSHIALILCHGLASNGSRWQELCDRLSLPPDWCILIPDLRGHGRSAWRGFIGNRQWLDDLSQMLGDRAIRRYVIGGHCLGANLALRHVAVRLSTQPADCCGLVLVEPMLPQARRGFLRVLGSLRWLLLGLSALIVAGNYLGVYRRTLPWVDLFELDRITRQAMQQEGSDHALKRRYAAPLHDLRYMHSAAYLLALRATLQPLPPLEKISVSCLVLLSSGGLFGDPIRTRSALEQLPHIVIHELVARHWIPTEQPEVLRSILEDWLHIREQTVS
jgi:pimeloyl-ACP methyl ester carboxylesterase